MKTYEELQKEWNESTYGNEFAHYVYSLLEKENKELKQEVERLKKITQIKVTKGIPKINLD